MILAQKRFAAIAILLACIACRNAEDGSAKPRSSARSAMTQGLVASPTFELDPYAVFPDFRQAAYPSISGGDGQYLVVIDRDFCLTVQRVSMDGGLLDPGGVCAAPPPELFARRSASAWDGHNWLLVWQSTSVFATRVTADGRLLDEPPLVLATNSDYAQGPAVAFNGSEFLVTWATAGTREVQAVRVLPDAGIVDPAPFVVADAGRMPAVASLGSQFLLTWMECCSQSPRVFATRFSSDAGLLDVPPMVLSAPALLFSPPAVSSDGTQYFVAWTALNEQVRAHRITADGGLVTPAPIFVGISGYGVAAAFDGQVTTFIAGHSSWQYPGLWEAAQVLPDGATVAAGTIYQSSNILGGTGGAALRGQAMALVSDRLLRGIGRWGPVVMGLPVDLSASGGMGTPFPIQTRVNSETEPAFAGAAGQLLVVWRDDRDITPATRPSRIFATLLPATALPLQSPSAFPITDGGIRPRAAADGLDFLVSWEDGADVFVGRVLADGGLPDFPGLRLGTGHSGEVVRGQNEYVVLWTGSYEVTASRVSFSGVITSPAEVVASSGEPVANLRAAREADSIVAVWEQGSPTRIQTARLWLDGGLSADGGVPLSPTGGPQRLPSIASDGVRSLVVWQDEAAGVSRLRASLSQRDGGWSSIAPGFTGQPVDAGQTNPSVVFDGLNYLVVWLDGQQLLAARLDSDGLPLDTTPLSLELDAGVTSLGAVAVGDGHTLVMSSRANLRLRMDRLVGQYVNEGGCTQNADCAVAPECHQGGTCDPFLSTCGWANAPDNSTCADGGVCWQGTCSQPDAGAPMDAGSRLDAGATDAGATDAGAPPDAGPLEDAGTPMDAGMSGTSDGGAAFGAGPFADGVLSPALNRGCGCGAGAPFDGAFAVAMLWLARRRRGS